MAKYSKFNIIYLMQKWMDSVAGQTFMNYAYSWGASIVILGTLFKLTHLPGANIMLFIGMGTEVFVFFISAFDRPFDKTTDGMDLASDEELAKQIAKDTSDDFVEEEPETAPVDPAIPTGPGIMGGAVILGGSSIPSVPGSSSESSIPSGSSSPNETSVPGEPGSPVVVTSQVGAPAPAVSYETAEAMELATTTYVDRLNELNELLLKVGAQSERITTDSEEMENLNRTLTGISRVYEMLLKNASQQMMTQDEINAETQKLAKQIADLNAIYARMIEAMTVNMPGGMKVNS